MKLDTKQVPRHRSQSMDTAEVAMRCHFSHALEMHILCTWRCFTHTAAVSTFLLDVVLFIMYVRLLKESKKGACTYFKHQRSQM